jgi:hypothetical protein
MDEDQLSWLFYALVLVPVAWGSYIFFRDVARQEAQNLSLWRAAEQAEVNALSVKSKDPRFALDLSEATLMLRKEQERRSDNAVYGLNITRIWRNPAGEYFYWFWQSDQGLLFKHITQVNARILLKDNYMPVPLDADSKA